jgi:hypothetical protein
MVGITQAQAETQLAVYLDAETKILAGQAVTMNGRGLTRADLSAVQAGIKIWDKRVQRLTRGGLRSYRAVPLD